MKNARSLICFAIGLACLASKQADVYGAESTATATVTVTAKGPQASPENFKGKPPENQFTLGALAGMGLLGSEVGFALVGTAANKIVKDGFIGDDINDQVFLEVELGPLFISGSTALVYSLHLRWDFQMDDQWAFYALGGLGGDITPDALGGEFDLYPRFGAGAFWKISPELAIRGELSHELIVAGVSFGL